MIEKEYLLGDRYRIIDTLGEGGMANVYLAEDIILKRQVAVKILRLGLLKEPKVVERFEREALATSELSHPNIVSVLDVGSDQDMPYMVMEYISGPNLKEYIQEKHALKPQEVIHIMDQILSAVTLAHKHNVIHRDLKPQNILLDKYGNVKIADFGIAVALNQSTLTQTNSTMGSVRYMSPEQTRGGLVTKQSDIYSLGIILYELLAGAVPFDGDTAVAIALKQVQEPVPSLIAKGVDIPQALENVFLKATAKNPRSRYVSAYEMKQALDMSLDKVMQDVPAFSPKYTENLDQTLVLSKFDKEDITDSVKKDSKIKKAKSSRSLKKHKWWWSFIGLATSLIVILLVFVLSGRNQVNVPNVNNLTEDAARLKLEKVGLRVGQVKRKYSERVTKGAVISSLPNAKKSVKRGHSVDLYISKGQNKVTVPDLINNNYFYAKTTLEKLGLSVKRENQYNAEVSKYNVLEQSVSAGQRVVRGSEIVLLVSKGPEPKVENKKFKLKNLRNYLLTDAQDYATKYGLTLQIVKKNSDKIKKDHIISLAPQSGTKIERGATITVYVSKGKRQKTDNLVTKTFTVKYKAKSKKDKNYNPKGGHVQIYIADDQHSLGDIYRDLYIKQNTNFSVPFSLKNGAGGLKVVYDNQAVINKRIKK